MVQQKTMIKSGVPVLTLMFHKRNIIRKSIIPTKINREDSYNYSMVFEGLASLCFRKRKPCQNPIQTQESTFYLGKFHCQPLKNLVPFSTLQKEI